MASGARTMAEVRAREEHYPEGGVRVRWQGGRSDDGRYLLDGVEAWYYPDGRKQREATYRLGRKTGIESYWAPSGALVWSWEHGDGGAVWRQYGPDGRPRAESHWRNFRAHGPARLWDASGKVVAERAFKDGRLAP
jgi:antitoxin component YwqK of YwqJK toxin-antitoxin module